MGRGGLLPNTFDQVSSPINLLKSRGTPPTAPPLAKTKNNY